ncbi:hypothetical protein DIS24_g11058 [Lasiodiplodia hormozganensis]|uniref:Uncharacterized protein n=1 Tax=Lasiodiplodia hormozganensis TaxID=869390 RepID=A0AA40C5A2_9PEZI|nr:hypothetical protein DIS24_g11058 [Lasiodiplodia hormozganensis]
MAVIWGLDLKEMQWGKFKNSYMWNNEYHLRRTKFIVYQCAMIFCVISESLGTAVLSDYIDQQRLVAKLNHDAYVYNNDYVGAGSYNIFVGVYIATIFGGAFFFDLFWPERRETPQVKLAWRICSVLACVFALSSALTMTVITATHFAYVAGVSDDEARRLLAASYKSPGSPMQYRHSGRAIASVVFLWPGFVATVASTVIMWKSLAHNDRLGPKSTHAREAEKGYGGAPVVDGPAATSDGVARPEHAHVNGSSSPEMNGEKAYEAV